MVDPTIFEHYIIHRLKFIEFALHWLWNGRNLMDFEKMKLYIKSEQRITIESWPLERDEDWTNIFQILTPCNVTSKLAHIQIKDSFDLSWEKKLFFVVIVIRQSIQYNVWYIWTLIQCAQKQFYRFRYFFENYIPHLLLYTFNTEIDEWNS